MLNAVFNNLFSHITAVSSPTHVFPELHIPIIIKKQSFQATGCFSHDGYPIGVTRMTLVALNRVEVEIIAASRGIAHYEHRVQNMLKVNMECITY